MGSGEGGGGGDRSPFRSDFPIQISNGTLHFLAAMQKRLLA